MVHTIGKQTEQMHGMYIPNNTTKTIQKNAATLPPPPPSSAQTDTYLHHPEGLVRSVRVQLLVLRHVHHRRRGNAAIALRPRDAQHAQQRVDPPPCRRRVVLQDLRKPAVPCHCVNRRYKITQRKKKKKKRNRKREVSYAFSSSPKKDKKRTILSDNATVELRRNW